MWTLKRIERYIEDGIEENIHLDYKGAGSISKSDGKKKEISKDVSAFTNSDGGIIIYGVREFDDPQKNHLPEKIEPIDGKEFTKEWLEQVINSSISPRIKGIKITPVQVGEKEDNQVVYVVEIPKSNTAHQSKDKRYYKRFNFESQMMEDYEIKDIINRISKTQIRIHFEFTPSIKLLKTPPFPPVFDVAIWIHNSGNKVVKYVDCYMIGNSITALNIIDPLVQGDFEEYFSNVVERKATIGEDTITINQDREAILPSTSRNIGIIKLKKEFLIQNNTLKFSLSTEDNVTSFEYTGKEILE